MRTLLLVEKAMVLNAVPTLMQLELVIDYTVSTHFTLLMPCKVDANRAKMAIVLYM